MVSPCSDRIARVPPYSYPTVLSTCTGLSPIVARLSILFQFLHDRHWPHPRSLATTSGVSVDVLSSGYLDVSVLPVCSSTLWIHVQVWPKPGVAPFGYSRIKARSQLPVTFRSVPRPSSPLSAKASTERPYLTSYPHHRPRTGPNHAPYKNTTYGQQRLASHQRTDKHADTRDASQHTNSSSP